MNKRQTKKFNKKGYKKYYRSRLDKYMFIIKDHFDLDYDNNNYVFQIEFSRKGFKNISNLVYENEPKFDEETEGIIFYWYKNSKDCNIALLKSGSKDKLRKEAC